MTVETELCRVERNWTGIETSFSTGFKAKAKDYVKVAIKQTEPNEPVPLSRGVHFDVTLAADDMVTVVPLTMPAPPLTLIIERDTAAIQGTNFEDLARYTADVHEDLHDLSAMRDAELRQGMELLDLELDDIRDLVQAALSLLQQNEPIEAPTFDSRLAVSLATISLTAKSLSTRGFASGGDGGAAIYKRIDPTALPSYTGVGRVRSVDRFMPDGSTNATNGGWWQIAERKLSSLMFGAKHDDSADDTTALRDLITCAKALFTVYNPPYIIMAPGISIVSGKLTFDLPSFSTIEWHTEIRYTGPAIAADAAVQIGSTAGTTFSLAVIGSGIHISRYPTIDATVGSIGVGVHAVSASTIWIKWISQFFHGLYTDGGNGSHGYNRYFLGYIIDNKQCITLAQTGAAGFNNENNYFGGEVSYTSNWTNQGLNHVGCLNLFVDFNATTPLNNHRFWGTSFEGVGLNKATDTRIVIHGRHIALYHPRFELIAEVALTANSWNCTIFDGYGDFSQVTYAANSYHYIKMFDGIVDQMLPTTNPARAGQLWNDSGTVKISAG